MMAKASGKNKQATLQDIADRCGVTRMTVWRALNNEHNRMSAATLDKILTVARELNYDPSANQAASRLVNTRTGKAVLNQVVAFVFHEEYHSNYFRRILEGMMETLIPVDYGLLLYHSWVGKKQIPVTFRRGDVDALVVYHPIGEFQSIYDQLRAMPNFGGRPVVSLLSTVPGCSSVLTDDYAGGYAAAAHLLDLGHRHLLYDQLDHPTHALRHQGYRQAYRDRGLDPETSLIPAVWSDVIGNRDFVGNKLRLLSTHPEVTGVLAAFDEQAILLCQALAHQGIRVPEDYSIVGFDDTDSLRDAQGNELLTTVRIPVEEIGRAAAQVVLRRLGDGDDHHEVITLPTELIIRHTTAPPRSS